MTRGHEVMRSVADVWFEDGIKQGHAQGDAQGYARGIERGYQDGIKELVISLYSYGDSVKKISKVTKLSLAEIEDILKA